MKVFKIAPQEKLDDVICDICNRSTRVSSDDADTCEYAELKADWGFRSKKEGEHHEVHLCEGCYDKVKEFIESVGGKVRIEDYL